MSVLQILMNVKNKLLSAHQTRSASTYQVPSLAQVGSAQLGSFPQHCMHSAYEHKWLLCLVCSYPEASSLSAASVVGTVMVVVGGVAALLLLLLCYRR